MSPHIIRPVLFTDSPVIDRLDSVTILGVAERLKSASTFEDFVYRESEMDALFTLADIALNESRDEDRRNGAYHTDLVAIRDLVFAAHDFTHDSNVGQATELLEQAAHIAARING
jgi:hypothetical protein